MFKKGIKGFGLIIFLLLILLLALPVVFKTQISNKVKDEINSQVNGHVDYDGLSFSLLKSFPNPSISLKHFVLTAGAAFNNDTIASVNSLDFSVDIWSVLRGHNYSVTSFNIVQPVINLRVNKDGAANWEVMKYDVAFVKNVQATPTEKQADFSLQVNSWKAERVAINYSNDAIHTYITVGDLNTDGSQSVAGSGYLLKSHTGINQLNCTTGGITYLSSAKLNADIHFTSDAATGLYTIDNNNIQIDALQLQLSGTVKNTATGPDFNLTILSKDSAFKSLLSLLPVMKGTDTTMVNATGSFSFSGAIRGLYHGNQLPAITCALKVCDASINSNQQAQAIKKINFSASIVKPEGPMDSMVISSQAHIATGANDTALIGLLIVTPVTDAGISAQVDGSFAASVLPCVYDGDDGSGLHVHLKFSGRKSDMATKNYKAISASGYATLSGCSFKPNDAPVAVNIGEAVFTLHPDIISLDKLLVSIGKTHFTGTGKLDHTAAYLSGRDRLAISVNLSSDLVSYSDLIGSLRSPVSKTQNVAAPVSTATGVTTEKRMPPALPDVSISIYIKKAIYNQLVFENLKGQVQWVGDKLTLQNISAGILGGSIQLNSNCNNLNAKPALFAYNVKADNIDIQKVYKATAKPTDGMVLGINGIISVDTKGTFMAEPGQGPAYNNITADGNLTMPVLKLDELPVLTDIARLAKVSSLDHLEARNTKSVFHFKNGKITFEPTDIKFTTGTNINFAGSFDASQDIDADVALSVPVKNFGQVGALAQNILGSFMKMPQNMQFKFKITGPASKPAVKVLGVGTSDN